MAISNSIESLIQHAQRLKIEPLKRRYILDGLKYLLSQSLCDLDRRHSEQHLKSCFKMVTTNAQGTNLLQMPSWRDLEAFAGERPSFIETPKVKVEVSKFDSWSAEKFFEHLGEKVRTKRPLPEKQNTELYFALTLLREQSKHVRYQRDYRLIKATWKTVLELSKKTSLYEEYSGAEKLRNTLRFFLTQM